MFMTSQVETIRANVIGCLNLADVCLSKNIHMTYFGTGCIFHYDENFPQGSGKGFKEEDKPNFTGSYYSYTKVSTAETWLVPCPRILGCSTLLEHFVEASASLLHYAST